MSNPKKYSVLYSYIDLEGLEKALLAINKVMQAFKDAEKFQPTLIPAKVPDEPLAQRGYIGASFLSRVGPILPIKVREHDKSIFDYEAYVAEGEEIKS